MGSRRLEDLHSVVAEKARALLALAAEDGIQLLVTSTLRSFDEQATIYAQGRTRPGKRVTNARPGQSWHNFGLAFDVVPLVAGKPVWNSAHWARIGALGRSVGLIWGGDFCSFKDRPHFEYHPNMTLAECNRRHACNEELLAEVVEAKAAVTRAASEVAAAEAAVQRAATEVAEAKAGLAEAAAAAPPRDQA